MHIEYSQYPERKDHVITMFIFITVTIGNIVKLDMYLFIYLGADMLQTLSVKCTKNEKK